MEGKTSNLELYEKVRGVPNNAKKEIKGGKLNGKTDINPVWRIKVLTEQFGQCGIGWYTEPLRCWVEAGAKGEVAVFFELNLYVKTAEGWSKPIFGTGGSMLVDTQKGALVTNDDAYKMAETDAISVACKKLGIGADVYWEADKTKYDKSGDDGKPSENPRPSSPSSTSSDEAKSVSEIINGFGKGKDFDSSKNTQNISAVAAAIGLDLSKSANSQKIKELITKYAPSGLSKDLSETAFFSVISEICDGTQSKA